MSEPRPLSHYSENIKADLAAKNNWPSVPERISALADFYRFLSEFGPAIADGNKRADAEPVYAVAMGSELFGDFWVYINNLKFAKTGEIATPPLFVVYLGIHCYRVATMPPFMWGLTRYDAIKAEIERCE